MKYAVLSLYETSEGLLLSVIRFWTPDFDEAQEKAEQLVYQKHDQVKIVELIAHVNPVASVTRLK